MQEHCVSQHIDMGQNFKESLQLGQKVPTVMFVFSVLAHCNVQMLYPLCVMYVYIIFCTVYSWQSLKVCIIPFSGGESKDDFWRMVHLTTDLLPEDKPRYLMGVGFATDLVVCCALGVDMFDCVFPTRTAVRMNAEQLMIILHYIEF